MNQNTRVTLDDSFMSAVYKLTDGNPGAVVALSEMSANIPTIDPDCALGALAPILDMDTLGIYGERLWMFYKNVCQHDNLKASIVLRGHQLGHITDEEINNAIDNNTPIDFPLVKAKIQEFLPNFAKDM